jgi:hypothetical protein
MSDTALDLAHRGMEAAPEDDAARLRFFERLADCELFLLLARDADGDQIEPQVFPLEEAQYVLAFDTEARLAEFADGPAPFAALSGRVLTSMLAGQNIGLGLNLDVAPSSMLIPSEALSWLNETLGHAPDQIEATPTDISAPSGLPEALITALDQKLATATGLAKFAYLANVSYDNATQSHILAFVDAIPDAQTALVSAVREALVFSGIEAGALDVAFVKAAEPIAASFARHGLRFDLPQPAERTPQIAPGSDPGKPPILR